MGHFLPSYSPNSPNNQILKKWKTHLEILSFYIYVPKIMTRWCMVPEILLILILGSKFWKNEKKAWWYFQKLCVPKIMIRWCTVPEICCATDRQRMHRLKKDILRWVPHPNIAAIKNAEEPKNVSELKSFLGLLNYYHRHSQGFADIVEPLHNLLRKGVKWGWQDREKCIWGSKKNPRWNKLFNTLWSRKTFAVTLWCFTIWSWSCFITLIARW